MKASLPAHLMIILGASERPSSSWLAGGKYKFDTKNKAWSYRGESCGSVAALNILDQITSSNY